MFYFALAFTTAWVIYFLYLFYLHRHLAELQKRLRARENENRP
ncbi:MAG TPA: hypothetical protein VMW23_04245 [Sedimentisphaerales bacterium]|nr:hypothetical protein [Sedimentisphaerales bacterium]